MKPRRIFAISLGLALIAATCVLLNQKQNPAPENGKAPTASARAAHRDAGPTTAPVVAGENNAAATETAPAEKDFGAWTREKPRDPDFAKIKAFDDWLVRWQKATPEERAALAEEGRALAADRRPEFKALIATNPRLALSTTIDPLIRQDLPKDIDALLEKRVNSKGNYDVYNAINPNGPAPEPTIRYFEADGVSYQAYVFGEMEPVMSRKDIPLAGVAVDRPFAVAESPLYQYKVGERIPAGVTVQDTCPVSGKTTEAVSSGEPVAEATPTVEVGGELITLCNGSHVTVLDEKYRTLVQAAGPGGGAFFMDSFPGTSSKAIGNFRILYIRATYPDQMSPPNTEDVATDDLRNTARYYLESSYGKMTTTYTVTSLITLPQTLKWYQDKDLEVNGLGVLQTQARAEARKLGYDSTQYDCIVLRVNGGLRSGSSWGGGDSVWLGWGGMGVMNHECGHSLGRSHANFWSTNDGTAYGNGANQEYGNDFDVMGTGSSNFAQHYNIISKRALGWLPDSYISFPKTNGTYRIYAYDQPRLEEGKRYGLMVQKDSVRSYNIEYHPAIGGKLADSAVVIYGGMGSNAGHLLDTTPGSPGGKGDGGIAIGRTYSDWESDQHFTVLSKNITSPPSLDVVYNRGPFPGNVAPTATLATTGTTVAVGGSVTFTATATDANGDTLAYHWQFDDGITGTNNAVFTRSFPVAAQVTALLTVSDMKGGSVRRSVVINVGSHGKQAVTGTVTAGGSPLAGVFVSNGTRSTFTDVDGTYSLSGLNTGANTLTAALPGYTFTPSTANPYTVVAGTNTVNWTAAGSTFVTLTKTADSTEGGTSGNFRFTRTGDTSAALVVSVAPVGGTAVKTTDYTFAPDFVTNGSYRDFTIPAGSATLDVAVAAVNDTAQEGPENITLQIVSGVGYTSSTANSVVMNLIDNDTTLPQVAVTAPDPYATENGDGATFTFTRTGSTAAALNLTVAWTGSATNGTDYTTLPTTVTIPIGQSSVDVAVGSINDSTIEGPEDIIATISTAATYVRDASLTTATVVLTDDDSPVVSVSVPDSDASEAGPDSGMFLITRTGSTAAPLTVYYGLSGTAFHGNDYVELNGTLTIPAGASSAPVVITPYDDNYGEPAETVTLAVTTFNNGYSLGSSFQGTVTIADNNDAPTVSVRAGTVGVEGGANATVVFHSTGTGSGNVTVNYTVSGTATAGSDYTALSGSVSVPVNGSNDTTVTIPVTNDALAEPTETVVVTITPGSGYALINEATATAQIRDNDSGDRVMVSAYNSSASEAGSAIGQFYISRPTTVGDLTVNYTLGGTATNGTDYASLSGSAVIPDTASGVVVTVTPVDDAVAEGTETVTMNIVAAAGYGVDLAGSATLEIADNDTSAVTVGFQQVAATTTEQPGGLGEYRDIPVILSASSASAITVQVVAGSGADATGDDVDWAFADAANGNAIIPSATLTFAPGTTTRNVRIRVKNDGIAEGAETIVLELRAPSNASLTANRSRENILVFDTAVPALVTEERWNSTAVYTNNTWSSVTPDYTGFLTGFTTQQGVADNYSRRLTGIITAPATGTYNFWIASDDASRLYVSTTSSAANKVQVATVSGYSGFQDWDAQAGQKSANITLTAGQTYYVEVQHQEGGGGDHASVAWQGPGFTRVPLTLDVPDTAPRTVRLFAGATTRVEGDGSEPQLQVVLDRPAGPTAITVNYSASGTATNGSDYTLSPGTLTFNAGEQMKSLPLAILTDAIGEAPESIVVTLSSPSGASLTSPSSHVITLLDANTVVVPNLLVTATSAMSSGTVLGTATGTPAPGRSITGWSIVAGNTSGTFAINASGQVTLAVPGSLPNPGTRQLVIRATDNLGSVGDGTVNVIANPPFTNAVNEKRFSGSSAYDGDDWDGAPIYTGTLATFTTPQTVADNYSRQLTGCIQAPVTGSYTFWIASDDQSRLFLSTDENPANKVLIATVSDYTGFQAWDVLPEQKSVTVSLVAGKVYYLEVQHYEGGGGDHVSVAWQIPSGSRVALPASVVIPQFPVPPTLPSVALTAPLAGVDVDTGDSVALAATSIGGSVSVTAVEFYRDSTLIGSDATPPYTLNWTANTTVGAHTFSAKAVYTGGSITSTAVAFDLLNTAPAFASNPITGATATKSAAYSATIASYGSDVDAGDTITFSKVSGPAWLSVASNGALSGTPALGDVGANAFVVKVTDNHGANVNATLNITVNNTNTAPTFTANPITGSGATEDAAYTASIASYGSDADPGDVLTFSKISGPAWLGVASNGALTGTPDNSNVGANAFSVRVTDASGAFANATLNITVANTNDAPVWTTNPITGAGGNSTVAYSGSIASYVSDVDVGETLTFSKVSGPSWLAVAANGALSGTPGLGDGGLNVFSVKVTDAAGANVSATLNIPVISTDNNGVFTNLAGGTWSTTGNWSGGTLGNGSGKTADFGTLDLTANATVTLDSARIIGNLTFDDTGAASDSAWTLTGSTLTLAGGATSTINTGTATTINTVLAGSNSLTKTGTATLTLGGVNTFSGGIVVQQGRINVTAASSLGSGAIAGNSAYGSSYSSGGNPFLAVTGTGAVTVANNIAIANPGSTSYYAIQKSGGGSSLVLSGVISGGGTNSVLQLDTPNSGDSTTSITLSGNNTVAGQIRLNRGTLTLTNANAAGTSLIYISSNTNTAGNLIFSNSFTLANRITIATASNAVSTGANDVTLSGIFTSGVAWAKVGTGQLTLTGANAITGTSNINAGTLAGTSSFAGPVAIASGATLAPGVNGIATQTISSTLTLAGTTSLEISKAGATLAGDKLTGITTVTYGGALVVTDIGPDDLTATNSFQLFSATTYTGSFSSITLPTLNSGLVWDTSSLAVNGTITVRGTPLAVNDSVTTAEDTLGTFDVTANDSDPDGDAISLVSVTQGAHGTVAISGTNVTYDPDANWYGSDSFTYTITDGSEGPATATVNVTVTSVNDGPVFTANPITGSGATEDSAYTGTIASYGSDADTGDTLTYSKVSGPAWLSVASNGNLTGTPGNSNVGANAFVVKVTDAAGANVNATLNISVTNVNDAPTFTANPITGSGATEDVAYTGSIASYGNDIDAGDTITYSKVSGPAWLSVASNGALSGTPLNANVGANAFVVKVTDAAGANVNATLNIAVTNVNDAPTFTANPITGSGATEDSAYTGSIASYGNDIDAGDTLTFAKVSGPAWLAVAGNGNLSGTPDNSDVGANAFVVKVTDAAGANVNATLNITVTNVNDAPVFASALTGSDATAGIAYTGTVSGSATDADSGDTFTYSKTGGPSWLAIASNGALTGTAAPADGGSNVFTVRATDAAGLYAETTLTINVVVPDLAADPDGDGFTTGLEITLGTDPFNVASVPGSIYANLRGWWKLDETTGTNADDSTGRVQDGTIAGGPASATGILGNALNFDATDDGIIVGPSAGLSGTTDFTVMAWVKVPAGSGSGTIIQQRDATANGYNGEYQLNVLSNGGVQFFIYNGGYQFDISTAGGFVNDNQWHLVAATRSGTTGTVYVDGNPLATASGAAKSLVPALGVSIGYDYRDNNKRFKGLLDDVRLYSRALSASELNGFHDSLVANRTPVFAVNPFTKTSATVSTAYSGSLTANGTDPDYDVLTYAKVSGPSWLTVASNGTLSGTPAAGDLGSNAFTVSATDPDGLSASATMNIVVLGALPAGWTAADIGSVGVTGSSGQTSGTYTISGAGGDIWGTADAFRFTYTSLTGDGEIRARVTSQTNTGGWAKAGVMIRDGTAAGSAHSMMVVSPSNGFANQYRTTAAGASTHIAGPALNAYPNNWVRVTRCGTLFTTYVSANGTTWTQVGQQTITMASTVSVGLAVNSTSTTAASTATFDNVAITAYPSPWVTADIGTPGVAGRSEYYNAIHTLNGAGVIGGTADGFRFTYQALSGDGDITARIPTFANTGTSSRIGVMMRDTLTPGSNFVFLGTNGAGVFSWNSRTTTGGTASSSTSGTATAPNVWVRLVRVGSNVTVYSSVNGTSWTTVGTTTVTMGTNCYVGLAVGSGNTTGLNTSTFDNITVTP